MKSAPRKWFAMGVGGIISVAILLGLYFAKIEHHIDITSGRMRHTIRIGSIIMSNHIVDTSFSRLTNAEYKLPIWHIESSYSYFYRSVSPHYQYHGIPYYLELYAITFPESDNDKSLKQKIANQILLELRTKEPWSVKESICNILEQEKEKRRQGEF